MVDDDREGKGSLEIEGATVENKLDLVALIALRDKRVMPLEVSILQIRSKQSTR